MAGREEHRGNFLFSFATVTLGILALDQASKLLIVTNLRLYQSIPESGLLRLTYVTNSGSAFGMLQGQGAFLILVSIIGVLGVLFYYRANGRQSALLRYALGLLLGGALGNLTDRLIRGEVVDFINVQLWSGFYFPTFNVADSALTIGLGMLAIYVLRQRAHEKQRDREYMAQRPSTMEDGPSAQQDVPLQMQDDHSLLQDRPSAQHDAPLPIQDSPSAQHDAPLPMQDTPPPTQDSPSAQQDVPLQMQDDFSLLQDSPSAQHDAPLPMQDTPPPTQDSPSAQQDVPLQMQDDFSLLQDSPSAQHDAPLPMQDNPPPTQDSPSAQQEAPLPMQDSPPPMQDSPSAQHDAPPLADPETNQDSDLDEHADRP